MVIIDEVNIIDVGGWKQANTIGTFDSIKGEWIYDNNTILHNDR